MVGDGAPASEFDLVALICASCIQSITDLRLNNSLLPQGNHCTARYRCIPDAASLFATTIMFVDTNFRLQETTLDSALIQCIFHKSATCLRRPV